MDKPLIRTAAAIMLACLVVACSQPPTLRQQAADLVTQGETERAIALLSESVRQNPRDKDAWNDLAAAWLSSGDPEEAVEAGLQAVGLDARYAPTRLTLGKAAYQAGRWETASLHLQIALDLDPTRVEAARLLAQSLQHSAASDIVRQTLQDLDKRFPGDATIAAALAQMSSAVAWSMAGDFRLPHLFTGDLLVYMNRGETELVAVRADRTQAWKFDPGETVRALLPGDGNRALAITGNHTYLLDLKTGEATVSALPPLLKEPQARFLWEGDTLLCGRDIATTVVGEGIPPFITTTWSALRLRPDRSEWYMIGLHTGAPDADLSADGRRYLITAADKKGADLYRDGQLEYHFGEDPYMERFSLTIAGDRVWSTSPNGTVGAYTAKGELLWKQTLPGGQALTLSEWQDAGRRRMLAAAETHFTILNEDGQTLATLPGTLAPGPQAPGLLLVTRGHETLLITPRYEVKARLGAVFPASFTPDFRWVYQTDLGLPDVAFPVVSP